MALPTVHIRKEAFLVLIWVVIETFKQECFGFILGYPPTAENNFYSVTDVIPFQKVKRANVGVDLPYRNERRFKNFISAIGGAYPKYLGDFHSHAEWGDYDPNMVMSEADLEGFSKTSEPLEFIVGISSRKKGKAVWEALPDGGVKGSFGKFNLHFNVYTLIEEGKKSVPQKLRIVAPRSIETLNRILLGK